jgi:hypothetical protein
MDNPSFFYFSSYGKYPVFEISIGIESIGNTKCIFRIGISVGQKLKT